MTFKLPRADEGKLMSQNRSIAFPEPRIWKDVVGLVGTSDPVDLTSAKIARATVRDFRKAIDDPAFTECIRLLVAIPVAARTDDFAAALQALDLHLSEAPRFAEVLMAASARIDRVSVNPGQRSDFLEIARSAFFETMATRIGNFLPGVMEIMPGDFQRTAARIASPAEFAVTARTFFASLVSSTLAHWLNRTLPVHTGPSRRFPKPDSLQIFNSALAQFCKETTRIIQEFSVGWYSGALRSGAEILSGDVASYSGTALRKIIDELQRKTGGDD